MIDTSDELIKLTATEAVACLRSKKLSPLDLVEASIKRIETVDTEVNALPIHCFDQARDQAKSFDFDRHASNPKSLCGLPIAVKDYNDDNTTAINKPLAAEQTVVSVNSASNFTVDDYIRLGEENLQIRSISGNELTVYRGVDGTTVADHADGSVIDILSGSRDATLPLSGDDALIASGDDFGFNEMSSFYEDFKQYSPSQQKDV